MKIQTTRGRLLASTMICGAMALALASPAYAQDEPGVDATEVEGIVVTGSRIQQRDLVANSPIETVQAEDLQETATITVETLLNTLPQVVPSFGSANNNPGNGQSLVNLRGLGSNRNIVLIDGRRVVPATSDLSVDLNTIPTPLIERIEIVTGGASAVYGADAVAGVVNFIMKDDFEGIEFDAQHTQSMEFGDAGEDALSLTVGGNFADDRGNAVVNFGYANREEVGKGDRAFTAQATNATSYFPSGTYRTTAANLPSQAAVNAVFAQYGVGAGLVPQTGGSGGFGFNGDGTLYATGIDENDDGTPGDFDVQNFRRDPGEIATFFFPDTFSYNFEPDNKLILPLTRHSFSFLGDYDVSEHINVYARANFVNYTAATALAPSPAPTAPNPYSGGQLNFTIPVTNPFIPDDLATLLASRPTPGGDLFYRLRLNALGPRLSSSDRNVWQGTAGIRWDMGEAWTGDAFLSRGRFEENEQQSGNLRVGRFEELLDAADGGASICGGGFNPFGVGFLSQGCIDYVSVLAKNRVTLDFQNAQATVTGPLAPLPAGDMQAALGAEFRSYDYNFVPDSALQPGEVAGFNGSPATAGYVDFYDLFGEVGIPLLKDAPFAQALDLTLGARFSQANAEGRERSAGEKVRNKNNSTTWKAELSWEVVESFRVRTSYQTAVRAANVAELFGADTEDNPEVIDPCSSDQDPTQAVLDVCYAEAVASFGITQAEAEALVDTYLQPNAQINALVTSNPDLDPEEAKTFTAGVIWRPVEDFFGGMINNLFVSVDYYKIKITDAIVVLDPTTSARRCYGLEPSGDQEFYCNLFTRSGETFEILTGLEPQFNSGVIETSGVDLSAGFTSDIGFGRIAVNTAWTWLEEYKTQTLPTDPVIDYGGTIGDNQGDYIPEWKGNVNLGWELDNWGVDLRGRYLGEADHEYNRLNDFSATGVDSTWYWDLATSYGLNDNVTLRLGVLNLFDQEVQEYDPFVDAQTDPATYDVIGRRWYAGVNLRY